MTLVTAEIVMGQYLAAYGIRVLNVCLRTFGSNFVYASADLLMRPQLNNASCEAHQAYMVCQQRRKQDTTTVLAHAHAKWTPYRSLRASRSDSIRMSRSPVLVDQVLHYKVKSIHRAMINTTQGMR